MKTKSLSIGILFVAITYILGLVVVLTDIQLFKNVDWIYSIGTFVGYLYFIIFFAFSGVYEHFVLSKNPTALMFDLDPWLFTPLCYGILAYLIDRFLLSRILNKAISRILCLLVIFALFSIPVLILNPPLADR